MQNRKTNLGIQNKNMFLIRKKLSLPQVRHSSAAVRDQSIMYHVQCKQNQCIVTVCKSVYILTQNKKRWLQFAHLDGLLSLQQALQKACTVLSASTSSFIPCIILDRKWQFNIHPPLKPEEWSQLYKQERLLFLLSRPLHFKWLQ